MKKIESLDELKDAISSGKEFRVTCSANNSWTTYEASTIGAHAFDEINKLIFKGQLFIAPEPITSYKLVDAGSDFVLWSESKNVWREGSRMYAYTGIKTEGATVVFEDSVMVMGENNDS